MLSALSHRLRLGVAHRPTVMLPLLRFRLRSVGPEQTVTRDTDLLIEGAGGSGNTFAHMAFAFAQERPVRLAGHTHAPAQIIQAVRWDVPVLVLIRDPLDSTVSLVSREHLGAVGKVEAQGRSWLERYVHFYANIRPLKDQMIVAPFNAVITDFGAVIRDVNARFDTDFVPFDHGETSMRSCFGGWSPGADATQTARKTRVMSALRESQGLQPLLDRARALFGELTN